MILKTTKGILDTNKLPQYNFVHENRLYSVHADVIYLCNPIKLPDGKFVTITKWDEEENPVEIRSENFKTSPLDYHIANYVI